MSTPPEADSNNRVASTPGVNTTVPIIQPPTSINGSEPKAVAKQDAVASAIRRISRLKKFVAKLKQPDVDPKSSKLSALLAARLSPGTAKRLSDWPQSQAAD